MSIENWTSRDRRGAGFGIEPALARDAASAPATADEEAVSQADAIVVTGSRLITDGNSSPAQVTVVTNEQLMQTTPSNVSDALRKLPQFAASTSQASTRGNGGAFSASSFLNLRSIGPVRNLVLFDGTRLVPSATSGAVDINTIPQMLIQRVEVVTGGVSACTVRMRSPAWSTSLSIRSSRA